MLRSATPVLLLALLAASGGCGGSEDPAPAPAPSTPATSSPTPDDASTAATPAATGPLLRMPLSSVRAPAGWELNDGLVSSLTTASDHSGGLLSLGEIEAFGGRPTLDQLVASWYRSTGFPIRPKELPPTQLDGVEVYHLSGKVQPLEYLEEFGAVVDDRIVTLRFGFSPPGTVASRQAVIDPVLASFQWR